MKLTAGAPNSTSKRDSIATTPDILVSYKPGPAETNPVRYLKRRGRTDTLLRFGTPVLIVLTWQLTAQANLLDQKFFPPPTRIATAFVTAINDGLLQEALAISIERLLVGYALGGVIGILCGFALGLVRPLRIALDPVISAMYTVPKLAILPLLLLIFGLGETPIILLILLGTFYMTVISTTAAVVGVPESYREPVRSFGASPFNAFRHVLLPAVLPEIFVGLRLAAGNAVLLVVGIEFVQGGEGIGWLIWNSWQLFLADRMYVGVVAVAVLGAVFQGLIKILGRRLSPWASARSSK